MNGRRLKELHQNAIEAKNVWKEGVHNAKFTRQFAGDAGTHLEVNTVVVFRAHDRLKDGNELYHRLVSPEHVAAVEDAKQKFYDALVKHRAAMKSLEEARASMQSAETAFTEYQNAIMRIRPDERF